jgi:hypothetical protein
MDGRVGLSFSIRSSIAAPTSEIAIHQHQSQDHSEAGGSRQKRPERHSLAPAFHFSRALVWPFTATIIDHATRSIVLAFASAKGQPEIMTRQADDHAEPHDDAQKSPCEIVGAKIRGPARPFHPGATPWYFDREHETLSAPPEDAPRQMEI